MSQFTIFTAFINGNCIMTIKQTSKQTNKKKLLSLFRYTFRANYSMYFIFLEIIFSKGWGLTYSIESWIKNIYVLLIFFFLDKSATEIFPRCIPGLMYSNICICVSSNPINYNCVKQYIQAKKKSEFSMDTSYICIMYTYVRYICTYMYFFLISKRCYCNLFCLQLRWNVNWVHKS